MTPLRDIIHEIFAENMGDFLDAYKPGYDTAKVLRHIVSCRTPDLGAAVYDCACGEREFVFHSCRDRHCPICQNVNNARWAEKQMASALPVKYFHIVFTLPDTLNALIRRHPRQGYDALFKAASSAILTLCAQRKFLGATPGFTAVLHTWGQTMQFHPHLHVIVTAGGLTEGGARFVDKSESGFLVPVRVLSRLFRGKFLGTFAGTAPVPKPLLDSLYRTEFFCYLKEPYDCAGNIVKYLASYANRVCISGKRILSYDRTARIVSFSYRDNRDGGTQKEMALPAVEFIRRFLLHVLPERFMKIRHYGLLNNRGKFERIRRCRSLLNRSAPFFKPRAAIRFVCNKCGGLLSLVGHFDAVKLMSVLRC